MSEKAHHLQHMFAQVTSDAPDLGRTPGKQTKNTELTEYILYVH